MTYSVRIRRNADGEVRQYAMDGCDWDSEGSLWLWTEGNYGCDCNRSLFFFRAKAEDEPEVQGCGMTAFTVINATLPNGDLIEIDEPVADKITADVA